MTCGYCQDCRYWGVDEDRSPDVNECQHVTVKGINRSGMFAGPTGDYEIQTRPGFGCVQFKAKP